jgi:hypothetical protein
MECGKKGLETHGLLLDGYIDLRTYTDTQLMAYIAGGVDCVLYEWTW